MAVALETIKGLTIVRKAWVANSPQILQVQHEVQVDDPAVLSEGTEVTFTDSELGFQFAGKIVTVQPNFSAGEGVSYLCADTYRVLVKTPGYITGRNGKQSAKIKFGEGTLMKTALNALLSPTELPINTLFPGGVDLSALSDPAIPVTDKGGQFLDSWIDDLLENTVGGIAYVDPNGGSPKLVFRDFYTEPDLDLRIGQFEVLVPVKDGDPVMEQANAGKTLDRKFERVVAEGCGEFSRKTDVFIPGVGTELGDPDETIRYKFTFPEKRVTGRFLDAAGKCRDIFIMKIRLGFTSGFAFTYFFTNPSLFLAEETSGQMFAQLDLRVGGLSAGNFPIIEAWFTYTAYDGPLLVATASLDPALDNEGDLWEEHPEFVKFTGPTNRDDTPKLKAITDALFKRSSEVPDLQGRVRIHIKGINTKIKIGARISNSEFSGARVQKIDFDYVERSMILDISTQPIRRTFELLKRQLQEKTVEGGGWFQNRSDENTNCFCGGTVFTDEGGGGLPRGNVDGDFAGTSFDCIQCNCQEFNDPFGQFSTLADCERVCNDAGPGGYNFVPCVGCVCAEAGGAFPTLAACEAANPNPVNDADCDFICDVDNGCQAVATGLGQYGTLAACQAACVKEGGTGDDGTSHSLGLGTVPTSATDPPDQPEETGPCAASTAAATFAVAAPSFVGGSSETPVVTLIKEIITDTCGRVITVNLHPEFSIVPKWQ